MYEYGNYPPLSRGSPKKREIAIRCAWQAYQRKGKINKARMWTLIRLRELERLYMQRERLSDGDITAAHNISRSPRTTLPT